MEDLDLLAAAHHEAGHIAVAHALDGRVDGMEVFWSNTGRWFGRSPTRLTKEDLDGFQMMLAMNSLSATGAKVALAGMLAQAKFLAAQQYDESVSFDISGPLDEIVAFLRDNKRTEESPGSVGLPLVSGRDGTKYCLEMAGFSFSTADSKAFNYYLARSGNDSPASLLTDTMRLVDGTTIWMRIRSLATRLLSQNPTGDDRKRSLSAEQLLDLLSSEQGASS